MYVKGEVHFGNLLSFNDKCGGDIRDIHVVNILREIYDEIDYLLANIPLGNQCRDRLFHFARKLRIAEALHYNPNVKGFIVDGRGIPPYRYKVILKGNTEVEIEKKDPQMIVSKLEKLKRIIIKPVFHPLVDKLKRDGIADVNLDSEVELNIVKELVGKGIAKVILVLDGIPIGDLHFKMRNYKPKSDTEKIKSSIAKVERLLNKLPKLLKDYLKNDFEELKRNLTGKEIGESVNYLGVCPKCGSKMRYDLQATQPRTFSGELKPRKICPKCGYSENEE